MQNWKRWVACLVVGLPIALARAADEPKSPDNLTGRDIAWKSYMRAGYKRDESTALRMRLVNAEGQIRPREFVRYQLSVAGRGKRTLMKFSQPDDIKDMGTYNEEIEGKDDIQYLWLPASDKLRRVSVKNMSWMGTDFNFEDIQEVKFENFTYRFIKMEAFDGHECYVYSKTVKKAEDSVYGQQVEWVRKEAFLPVKTLYYDKNMKELKRLEFTDLRPSSIPGAYYAWRISLRNLQDGHRTEIVRLWLVLDSGLDEKYAATDFLKKSIQFYNHPADMWKLWEEARKKETFDVFDKKTD